MPDTALSHRVPGRLRLITALGAGLAVWGLAGQGLCHGIPAKEEQFSGGIPVTDNTREWPALSLLHDGSGWQTATTGIPHNGIFRLLAHNRDRHAHLLVIGTRDALSDQALMHGLMPERRSDYPNTRWVEADEQATLVWEFNRTGTIDIRCLIKGHEAEAPLHLTVTPVTRP